MAQLIQQFLDREIMLTESGYTLVVPGEKPKINSKHFSTLELVKKSAVKQFFSFNPPDVSPSK